MQQKLFREIIFHLLFFVFVIIAAVLASQITQSLLNQLVSTETLFYTSVYSFVYFPLIGYMIGMRLLRSNWMVYFSNVLLVAGLLQLSFALAGVFYFPASSSAFWVRFALLGKAIPLFAQTYNANYLLLWIYGFEGLSLLSLQLIEGKFSLR